MADQTVTRRFAARIGEGPGVQVIPWLNFIHATNTLAKEREEEPIFGAPEDISAWWAGGTAETYPDAYVIHRSDGTVSITSRTERAAALFRELCPETWDVRRFETNKESA